MDERTIKNNHTKVQQNSSTAVKTLEANKTAILPKAGQLINMTTFLVSAFIMLITGCILMMNKRKSEK